MLDGQGRASAVVVLPSAAREFLYPLIQSWSTPSRSGDTPRVRRTGEEVIFLNDRLSPLPDSPVPAYDHMPRGYVSLQVILGKRGTFLAWVTAALKCWRTCWFTAAQVDSGEIPAYARHLKGLTAVIVTAAQGQVRHAKIGFAPLRHASRAVDCEDMVFRDQSVRNWELPEVGMVPGVRPASED